MTSITASILINFFLTVNNQTVVVISALNEWFIKNQMFISMAFDGFVSQRINYSTSRDVWLL